MMMMMSFDAGYQRRPMYTPSTSQMMSYNNAPVDDGGYMNNNATSYSRSSSSSTSSGNINGVPYSYSSGTENGVPFGYGSGNNNSYNARVMIQKVATPHPSILFLICSVQADRWVADNQASYKGLLT
jgi:hypothetical protein